MTLRLLLIITFWLSIVEKLAIELILDMGVL